MPDPTFAKGLFVEKNPKSPDFVVCRLSVKCKDFYEFMKEHVNEKGYVNIQVKKAKKDEKLYAQLDTWEPNQQDKTPAQGDMGFGPGDEMGF